MLVVMGKHLVKCAAGMYRVYMGITHFPTSFSDIFYSCGNLTDCLLSMFCTNLTLHTASL
jgi:hypothetical protein